MENKCEILGALIAPCKSLNSTIDGRGTDSKKGVNRWDYTNMDTGETSRVVIGVKTDGHKKGLAFNCCPFCMVKFPYAD